MRRVVRVVQLLLEQGGGSTHVVLQGLLPRGQRGQAPDTFDLGQPSPYTPHVLRVNQGLEQAARQMGLVTYVYCGDLFLDKKGGGLDDRAMPDALHPNALGMRRMSDECLAPVVLPLLEAARAAAGGGGGGAGQ